MPPKVRNIDEIDATIDRLVGKGLTDEQIAEEMGETHGYVRMRRWTLGLAPNRKPKATTLDHERILDLFDNRKMNASQIAAETRLTFAQVNGVLYRRGRRTDRGRRRAGEGERARRKPAILSDEDRARILAALDRGWSVAKTARDLGFARSVVDAVKRERLAS